MNEGWSISLGEGLASIPRELLLAQAQGKVLFIVGAGVSQNSGLPSFRELVLRVYKILDLSVYDCIKTIKREDLFNPQAYPGLYPAQLAEIRAYCNEEYDVVLGLLERRLDSEATKKSEMRSTVETILRNPITKPSSVHTSIVLLSNRGDGTAVVTTNFDLLLEGAARSIGKKLETYSIGEIMRPSLRPEFSGILHIHGALATRPERSNELVLTDEDFGQYYLRGRSIPDFIYDAARLYSIVLIGYSASDPPMKYLLSAVAADYSRFSDIKSRYAFIGAESLDPAEHAYWKGRGIQPIHYPVVEKCHSALERTLAQWSRLAPRKGRDEYFEKELLRIAKKHPRNASEADRERFEVIFELSKSADRDFFLGRLGNAGVNIEWLDIATGADRDGVGGRG